MIKVFLHISVHIGTKLSELAFPGTERHTRGREHREWEAELGQRTPLTETSMGERAGEADLCHLESACQTSRILSTSFNLQMGKEAQRGELA